MSETWLVVSTRRGRRLYHTTDSECFSRDLFNTSVNTCGIFSRDYHAVKTHDARHRAAERWRTDRKCLMSLPSYAMNILTRLSAKTELDCVEQILTHASEDVRQK